MIQRCSTETKGKNTGKDLNKGTICKIHLPFQLLCASVSFYIFSLETPFFFFFCSLHERIYSHEYLLSLYVAIYSASSSVLKFLRNSFQPNMGLMSIQEESAKPIKAGPHSTNIAAKGHSCGLHPLLR